MNIVIIGARGMLGHALAAVFANDKPLLWDKDDIDITDPEAVTAKITATRPKVIINAAAYTDVDGAESNRTAAFAVNETGVANLARAAKAIGATLIHYSTDYIFPGDNAAGYKEDDKPGPPVNVYGESKLAGEQALQKSGATYYLLRTAWLYGPNGKNFVDTILKLAKEKTNLKVVNDQQGSPTFTHDVAAATKEIIKKYPPAIYHTVNQGQTTWYDLARKIFAIKGLAIEVTPIPSAQFPRPARRPQYSMLINSRGPTLRPWEAALDDYLKNYTVTPS